MGISSIQSGRDVYSSYFVQNNLNRSTKSTISYTTKSNTVDISVKAQELLQKSQVAEITPETSYEDLPLEAFALPEWFSNWIPDEAILSDEVGLSLSLPNSGTVLTRNSSDNSKRIDELGEYVGLLLQYFQKELGNKGIEGGTDYYTSVLQNEKESEEIHQAVKNRIADDLRVTELMKSFGKNL